MWTKFKYWLDTNYRELIALRDSPHTVALSFAIGVFLGILPFTGVVAAVAVAWFFRLNKPAAILGSAITNTWLGFIVLGFSVKIGALFLGLDVLSLESQLQQLFNNFHWQQLTEAAFIQLLPPIAVGYVIISLFLAIVGYFIALATIYAHKARR